MTAENINLQRAKFLLILFASTVLTVLLHQIRHDPLMTLSTRERSIIITSGYFPPAAFISLAAAFCIIGLMFLGIQKFLHGSKHFKGALFGISLGGMYLVGMIEAYVVYPVSLWGELFTGMVDGSGILLMSLLLGKYMVDNTPDGERAAHPLSAFTLIIPAFYLLTRYFSYTVLHIESAYYTKTLATFLWTAGMGCWVGFMYMAVGRFVYPGSPFKQALAFGGLIFGVNWLIYNLFTLLFISVSIMDLFYRAAGDSFAVVLGTYLLSSFFLRKAGSDKERGRKGSGPSGSGGGFNPKNV